MSQDRYNKPWSDDEDRMLMDQWIHNNKTLRELASKHRRPLGQIVNALYRLKLLEYGYGKFGYSNQDTAATIARKSAEEAIINQILNLKFKGYFVKSTNGNIAKVPAPIKVAVGQLLIISEGGRNSVLEVDEVFDLVPMEHVKDKIPYIVENGLPELHEMRKEQEREARQLLIENMNQQFHEKALKLSEDFVGKEVMDEVADKLNNISWNNLIHTALFTGIRNAS